MLNQRVCLLLLLACCSTAAAATVELKGKASVTGTILEEKRDQVVIDIGYTVLVIPRRQVLKLLHDKDVAAKSIVPTAPVQAPSLQSAADPPAAEGFYKTVAASSQDQSVRDLVNSIGSAVVQIRTPAGLGSGFFINPDGFLISNFHVVEGETQISVEVYDLKDGQLDRKTYKQVRIVALNKFGDLALLHIEDKDAPKFACVPLGDSDKMAVGDHVFAIGSPMGLERTVTEGILSTKSRVLDGGLYLQTTAQINPGNSGGPLLNLRGEVVGVTNMKITFGEGLGFAIPAEVVKNFLNHRDAFAYDNDNPNNPYRYLEPPSRAGKTAAH